MYVLLENACSSLVKLSSYSVLLIFFTYSATLLVNFSLCLFETKIHPSSGLSC